MSAAKVFVVAEGPSEIGDLDHFTPSRRNRREGYLPPMLRKLLGVPVTITAQRVTAIGRLDRKPRLEGHGDRAAKALALASVDGCALVVFVKDVDREPGTKKSSAERKRRLKKMHKEIEAGFAAVEDADHVLRVKATPCRMIEAWALGDANALAAAAGRPLTAPARPEELWGAEEDSASNHPKCVLRRALGRDVDASVFEEIADASNAATLRKTCPESFVPFADEVEAAATKLGATPPSSRRRRR